MPDRVGSPSLRKPSRDPNIAPASAVLPRAIRRKSCVELFTDHDLSAGRSCVRHQNGDVKESRPAMRSDLSRLIFMANLVACRPRPRCIALSVRQRCLSPLVPPSLTAFEGLHCILDDAESVRGRIGNKRTSDDSNITARPQSELLPHRRIPSRDLPFTSTCAPNPIRFQASLEDMAQSQ